MITFERVMQAFVILVCIAVLRDVLTRKVAPVRGRPNPPKAYDD